MVFVWGQGVSEHMKARGQLVRNSFMLQACASWESNSGHEAWGQESLPVEHLACPSIYTA